MIGDTDLAGAEDKATLESDLSAATGTVPESRDAALPSTVQTGAALSSKL